MEEIIAHLIEYGLLVVFVNVFVEQLGAPIPAIPTLVVAGALVARQRMDLAALVGVALVAALLADTIWFLLGRWQGHRVLRTVCRLSLSPDSCVRGTEDLFERVGMRSLAYAKFIPGFSTIAPPLAGAMGTTLGSFILWDGLGSLLWIGSGLGLGVLFHRAIGKVLSYLETLGYWAAGIVGVALVLLILTKWKERRRVRKLLEMARISVGELKRLLDAGEAPVIVDVRNRTAPLHDPRRIPGALRMTVEEIDDRLKELPRDREIVLYCT